MISVHCSSAIVSPFLFFTVSVIFLLSQSCDFFHTRAFHTCKTTISNKVLLKNNNINNKKLTSTHIVRLAALWSWSFTLCTCPVGGTSKTAQLKVKEKN